METLIVIVHVLAALSIVGLVLIQHGKGADMGASFGSGASQTIFGSGGSGNALTKSTTWLATIFFITSLVLALFARQQASQGIQDDSLIENVDLLESITTVTPQEAVSTLTTAEPLSDLPLVDVGITDGESQVADETVVTEPLPVDSKQVEAPQLSEESKIQVNETNDLGTQIEKVASDLDNPVGN